MIAAVKSELKPKKVIAAEYSIPASTLFYYNKKRRGYFSSSIRLIRKKKEERGRIFQCRRICPEMIRAMQKQQ